MASVAGVLGNLNGRKRSSLRGDDLRCEADRLRDLHAAHVEALAVARRAQESTQERERDLPRVEADVVTGVISEEDGERLRSEITSARSAADERVEREERIVAELHRRVLIACEAVIEDMLRVAGEPVAETKRALAEAEAVAAERRAEHEAALAYYDVIKADADEVRCEYDADARAERSEKERRKRDKLAWVLRQPRMAVEQLPLAWQEEAYAAWDRWHEIGEAHWRRVEQERYGGAPRYDECDGPTWPRAYV